MSISPGTRLGPYEILSPIGAGGMGEVYRAKDPRLDRTVAIKILPTHFSNDPVRKQRFEREARAISGLSHPNICTLHDVGSQNGTDYLVMEYLDGDTLAQRLTKGALPVEQVSKIGREIADALEKAHRSGIIHRDLKPGNIMLTKSGAKLLDFGLARPVSSAASIVTMTGTAVEPTSVTQEGTIVGTFQYMSPEQVEGKELDARSDIFSLGAVLYEMVTGKRAFAGKSQLSVASAVLEKDPQSISEAKPLTPASLDHAIRRCLAKDPDERWQSAADLAGELRWIGESGSRAEVSVLRSGSAKSRVLAFGLLAAILALALIALGIAYLRSGSAPATPVSTYILPPPNVAFNAVRVISPDGMRIAFSGRSAEGKVSLWVRSLDSAAAQELAGTENGVLPFWSSDSQWLGFFANGKLRKIPASGGAVQDICDAPAARGGSWNSQGMIVFAPGTNGVLQKVSAMGGTPAPVTQMDQSTGETTHRWPDFLPDGYHFLYVARQVSEKAPSGVYVGSLDGNFRKKVLETTSNAQYMEPGYLLFVRDFTLFAQRFDAGQFSLKGDAIPIANDVQRQMSVLSDGVSASRGRILYTPIGFDSDTEFSVTDRSGNVLTAFPGDGEVNIVRVSPDGRKVASSVYSGKENAGVWIHDLTTGSSTRLVFTEAYYASVVWSPDGSQIAFSSSKTGPFNIYAKAVNGSGEEKALHPSSEDERARSWSPDGKYLIYDRRVLGRSGISEVMVLPLDSSERPYSLLNAPYANQNGTVSPDGRWIAFASTQSGSNEIYVTTFPHATGVWQISTKGGTSPRWRRDNRALFYVRPDGRIMVTQVKPGPDSLMVGVTSEIPKTRVIIGIYEATFDVFPDGQRFILANIRKSSLHAPLTLLTNWTSLLSAK